MAGLMSIMMEDRLTTVDVRDMLCAQALAVVAQAVTRSAASSLRVLFNAEDVRRDLTVWARERGWAARQEKPGALLLASEPPHR